MTLPTLWRKAALFAHVACSVGWMGAVVAYLALALGGLRSRDLEVARSAYLSMELVGWTVIVPFSLLTLLSGLLESLGTEWGLFRHYWVAVKFLMASVGSIVLLVICGSSGRCRRWQEGRWLLTISADPGSNW
jgi:hypothetical protein